METKTIVIKATKKGPEKKFRAGAICATVWRNETEKGSYASVNLDRNYKDGETWKSTGSLRVADIPKAVLVLSKAYEYLAMSSNDSKEDVSKEDVSMEDVM